jgi:hypothetical protein
MGALFVSPLVASIADHKKSERGRNAYLQGLSCPSDSLTKPIDLCQARVGRGGPGKRLTAVVVVLDKGFDLGDEIANAPTRTAANGALRDDVKPDLHLVEARGIGRCVVDTDPLAMRLSLRQDRFMVGEPVVLEFQLLNRGQNPITVNTFGLDTTTLKVWVGKAGGPLIRYQPWSVKDTTGTPLQLSPGESLRKTEILHFEYRTKELLFSRPGSYVVRGGFGAEPNLASALQAEATLEVVVPPPSESDGSRLFSQFEFDAVSGALIPGQNELTRLRDYALGHPGSTFGLYARYFASLPRITSHPARSAEVEEAANFLQPADSDKFQLQPEVLLALARASHLLDRGEAALEYLRKVVTRFPNSAAREKAVQMEKEVRAAISRRRSQGLPSLRPIPPLAPGAREALTIVFDEFFQAYRDRNLERCLDFLDAGFQYQGAVDREGMRRELMEDFGKRQLSPGSARVSWELLALAAGETGPEAEVLLGIDGVPGAGEPRTRVQVGFAPQGERWLLRTWRNVR